MSSSYSVTGLVATTSPPLSNAGSGKKDFDTVEQAVRALIIDGGYRHTTATALSPMRNEIDALKAFQESEKVIRDYCDARGFTTPRRNSLCGKLFSNKFKAKAENERRITDLSLALTKAVTDRCTMLVQNQVSIYKDQEERLARQQITIKDLKAQQLTRISLNTTPTTSNGGGDVVYRPESRASVASMKHDILSWLKAPGFEARHEAYSAARQREPDTCTWIYKSPEYQSWQRSDRPTCLWVSGRSGTGKSILMSRMVDDLTTDGRYLAYFYLGHCKTQTARDVAAALLKQLCKDSTIMPRTLEMFKDSHGPDRQPQPTDLMKATEELIPDLQLRDVTVLIDAWDKSNMQNPDEFDHLFSYLTSLPWKVLITSRSHCSSDSMPRNLFPIQMCDWSSPDLEAFVSARLKHDFSVAELYLESRLSDEIAHIIAEKSDKTFFLAETQTRRILEQVNIRDIRITLDELPWDPKDIIHQAFDLIMSQPETLRSLACKSLVWVANIERPLSVEALREGFATLPSTKSFIRRDLLRKTTSFYSCALVFIARSRLRGRVSQANAKHSFISPESMFRRNPLDEERIQEEATASEAASRQTTKYQFVETETGQLTRGDISSKAFESALARPTVLYQIDIEAKPPKKAFLGKAGCCMGLLVQEPGSLNVLLAYDGIKGYLKTYRRNGFTQELYNQELEHLATSCLYFLLQTQFARGPCSTEEAYRERINANPFLLYAATCWPGHTRKPVNPDLEATAMLLFESPCNLSAAVQVYLLNSVPSDSKDDFNDVYELSRSISPLQVATKLNMTAIIQRLIKDSDPLERDSRGLTALHEAMSHENVSTFKLLFDKATGTSYNKQHGDLRPDQFFVDVKDRIALLNFYKKRVLQDTTLLDAITADDFHATLACLCCDDDLVDASSLEAAFHSRGTKLMSTLLRFRAGSNHSYTYLLLKAVRDHRTDILNTLLNHCQSADPEVLMKAIHIGHFEMVALLFKHTADINATVASTGRGVLHEAAAKGSLKIVKYLLSEGADACQLDNLGRSPLFDAIDNPEIVKILLESNADIDAKDPRTGRGLLHEAVAKGNSGVAHFLLSNNADPSQLDNLGRTPLFDAIKVKDMPAIKQLLQYGVDIDAAEHATGQRALHKAAILGNEEILMLIINRSLDINYLDNFAKTPLDYAKDNKISRLFVPSRHYPTSVQELPIQDSDFPPREAQPAPH